MNSKYYPVASYEVKPGEKIQKILLLYSGGLDTTTILQAMIKRYQVPIVTLTLDVGQQDEDLAQVKAKALKTGAAKAIVLDIKQEFVSDYIALAIKANATYQGDYYISTISRYLLAKKAVEIAKEEGADVIAHGCTAKGNDQIRLETTILAYESKMKIMAPVREWQWGRDQQLAYKQDQGLETSATKESPYSCDDNLWGKTYEGGEIEQPKKIPELGKFLPQNFGTEKDPQAFKLIKVGFQSGLPCSLNDQPYSLYDLIQKLNQVGKKFGIGLTHHLEDRIFGFKVRGVYLHPAAHIIITAHKKLEQLVSTPEEWKFKQLVDLEWGHLAYKSLWLNPLKTDLDAFIAEHNKKVSGWVRVKLTPGQAEVVALDSPYSLFDLDKATFMSGDNFNHNAAASFIELYGLNTRQAFSTPHQPA